MPRGQGQIDYAPAASRGLFKQLFKSPPTEVDLNTTYYQTQYRWAESGLNLASFSESFADVYKDTETFLKPKYNSKDQAEGLKERQDELVKIIKSAQETNVYLKEKDIEWGLSAFLDNDFIPAASILCETLSEFNCPTDQKSAVVENYEKELKSGRVFMAKVPHALAGYYAQCLQRVPKDRREGHPDQEKALEYLEILLSRDGDKRNYGDTYFCESVGVDVRFSVLSSSANFRELLKKYHPREVLRKRIHQAQIKEQGWLSFIKDNTQTNWQEYLA